MLSDSVQRMGLSDELTPSKKAQNGQHLSPLAGANGDISNKKRTREEMISG
jgi:hypothetical protein